MNGLLVRVGADLSPAGGSWNGPVDSRSGEFAYVSIPENNPFRAGFEKPYNALAPVLAKFGVSLPRHLQMRHMHLDPDFAHLTYGDQRERAKQLRDLHPGDLIVFYAGLKEVHKRVPLVYAIIGLFILDRFVSASDVPERDWDINAHSRRVPDTTMQETIFFGRPGKSGRLKRCVPIGEYRNGAYRVRQELLDAWGGLTVNDGYLQRSGRLPRVKNPPQFLKWLDAQGPIYIQSNN